MHAQDLGEVTRLRREYVQVQMRPLAEPASEMGQIMSRTATDSVKPKRLFFAIA